MQFVHRSFYDLMGIHEAVDDPWVLLADVALEAVDAEFGKWLASLGLEDLAIRAIVTTDDEINREHDLGTTISNIWLDGLFLNVPDNRSFVDRLEEVRSQRRATSTGMRLAIDVTGENLRTDAELTQLDAAVGASYQFRNSPSHLIALSNTRAHELHHLIAGAVRLAVRREIQISRVEQSAWYPRPDGYPHFVLRVSGSARPIASMALPTAAVDRFPDVFEDALSDTRMRRAFIAYGQSMQHDLDPSLEFLSAFSALELLVECRTHKPQRQAPATRQAPTNPRGLRSRFKTIANGDQLDCDTFDGLYALRNGLAHEARFDVSSAHKVRDLFDKYADKKGF